MTDAEILALRNHKFPRGLVTVHHIENGKVYFVSKLDSNGGWYPWSLRRDLFEEAVAREVVREII